MRDRGSSSPAWQQTSVDVQDSSESQTNIISIKIPIRLSEQSTDRYNSTDKIQALIKHHYILYNVEFLN